MDEVCRGGEGEVPGGDDAALDARVEAPDPDGLVAALDDEGAVVAAVAELDEGEAVAGEDVAELDGGALEGVEDEGAVGADGEEVEGVLGGVDGDGDEVEDGVEEVGLGEDGLRGVQVDDEQLPVVPP